MRGIATAMLLVLFATACSSGAEEETSTTVAPAPTTATAPATAPETTEVPTTTGAQGASVTISNFTFNPGSLTVAAGTSVTFTNGDGPSHTTTSDDDVWDSGVLASGDDFEVVFADPGTFAYHCSIHPSMTATVTVEG